MEIRIGRVLISKKALQLIAYTAFIQGIVLGGYYAATDGFKSIATLPILYMAVVSTVLVLYKPLKREIHIIK
ncbi:hypothetical protein [Pontibacter sp. H249]|uniref:hypothetical protein n=1 Tax=Pontibacter sp. H249 TaxID=3133420 RepID=UPI0030C3D60D